jgi:hypothetical protein
MTVSKLVATDWGERPVVEIDHERTGRRSVSIVSTTFRILHRAVADRSDWILLLEDDLRFNWHLRYNLERWPPLCDLKAGGYFIGSLCNLGIREIQTVERNAYSVADPMSTLGSQALVLSAATARYLLENWEIIEGGKDVRIFSLGAQLGPIYYHKPSLVQHIGRQSTWGGFFRRAIDFQADWKSEI